MFFRWVMSRAIATNIEKILNTTESVPKTVNNKIGKAIPALIEDIDTIPVNMNTIRKITRHARVNKG